MTLIKREKKRIHRVTGPLLSQRQKLEKIRLQRRQKTPGLPVKDLLFTTFSLCALLATSLNQANPDRLLT
jgi:hypothetical protein